MTIALHELAQISAERLLNGVAEGLVIAMLAWFVLRVAGKQSSSVRFGVWFLALLSIAALPFVSVASQQSVGGTFRSSMLTLPISWAMALVSVWAAVAVALLTRVAAGLWRVVELRRSCAAVDLNTVDPSVSALIKEFGSRKVELCTSPRLQVPTAIGFFRPAVVLPEWTLREFSADELKSVVLHELAHLERRDDWTNLLQKVVRAVFFFHPAVWWVENRMTLEREMACDEQVLARMGNARTYAQCLVSMAEKSFMRRTLALAQAAVSRVRHTSLRVAQILSVGQVSSRAGTKRGWLPATGLVAVVAAGIVSLPHVPAVVAFEDSATTMTARVSGDTDPIAHELSPKNTAPARMVNTSFHGTVNSIASQFAGQLKTGSAQHAVVQRKSATSVPKAVTPDALQAAQRIPVTPLSVRFAEAHGMQPQAVFVVMQTEEYSAGEVRWQIQIVQFTVYHPQRNETMTAVPAKKT
jgi:beta-lactamase regulating signal transducer with metallopeptidase domain